MKNVPKHSDLNIGKSLGTYVLFDRLTNAQFNSLDNFLSDKLTDNEDKVRLWKIIKLFAFVNTIENSFICSKSNEFKNLTCANKEKIKAEIIKKVAKEFSLNEEKAKELLDEQIENNDDHLITPRILQTIGCYSLGQLIYFIDSWFSNDSSLIGKLKQLKEHRNFIFHNATSSTDDIDERLDKALELAANVKVELENKPI